MITTGTIGQDEEHPAGYLSVFHPISSRVFVMRNGYSLFQTYNLSGVGAKKFLIFFLGTYLWGERMCTTINVFLDKVSKYNICHSRLSPVPVNETCRLVDLVELIGRRWCAIMSPRT